MSYGRTTEKEKDYYDYVHNNDPGEFSSDYTKKADTALDDYISHGEFAYNPATDSSYQAAKKEYVAGANKAMKDTIGTATELTGGYNNSYAQTAAQQQYNSYMSELASLMPEYETAAYNRWKDESDRKYNYYAVLKDAEDSAYNKYRDEVDDYNTNRTHLYDAYIDARDYDYNVDRDAVEDYQWQAEMDQDAYEFDKDSSDDPKGDTNAEAMLDGMVRTGTLSDGTTVDTSTAAGQRKLRNAVNSEITAALKSGEITSEEAERLRNTYVNTGGSGGRYTY